MHTGELTETVKKRSVLRPLHLEGMMEYGHRKEKLSGLLCFTAGTLPGYMKSPWHQVTAAVNSVAAHGGEPLAVSLQGLIPITYEESSLREDMKSFAAEVWSYSLENGDAVANSHALASELRTGLKIQEVQIQVSDQLSYPQYFVTCIGSTDSSRAEPFLQPGQELILTRQIALAGTAALARSHEEELLKRFPAWLVEHAKGFDQWMSVMEVSKIVSRFGACPMHCLSQGGIFNALWEMAERAHVGLNINLREIPIRQESVEICEYFDVNPYYLYSEGALLIGTNRADQLIRTLQDAGIPAAVIGYVTDKNERVIHNGENDRYLDRPKQDELWRKA